MERAAKKRMAVSDLMENGRELRKRLERGVRHKMEEDRKRLPELSVTTS